jgi:hypothetical protein
MIIGMAKIVLEKSRELTGRNEVAEREKVTEGKK